MDTGGQETFNSLNKLYYKKADGVLLVYDITSLKSFNACKNYYIQEIKNECNKNVKVILLGNKTDLEGQREVTSESGANLSLENDFIFMETSCKNNYNVSDAFESLIEITNLDMKRGINKNDDNSKLNKKGIKKNKKKIFC